MGRLDEALRRAALTGSGRVETKSGGSPASGVDAAELMGEAFPDEAPKGQRRATASPVNDFPEAPEATPVGREVPSSTLLEHLDSGLVQKVVVDRNMMPASREQYRRLAAGLHHVQAASGLKIVMIASAVEKEGKTLTAANLALTLSESYRRSVLLIDADLRRPSLHTVFKLPGSPGLTEGLISAEDVKLPVHQVFPRLSVLTAGTPSSDPMAGLTSQRMRRLLTEARQSFQWVIIDTPPVGLLADANLLAAMVDGAVLVIKAGSTPYDLVKRATASIGPSKIVGVVLNRAAPHGRGYGYGYEGYYHASPAQAGQVQ